jgi:hypothetical protein
MNKKIILMLLALSGAATTLKAQTEKGTQLLGGNIGVYTNKNTNSYSLATPSINYGYTSKATTFSIGPNYSVFVANKLDLGVNLGYNYQNMKVSQDGGNTDLEKVNTNAFSAEVYLRKYFLFDNKIGIRTGPYFSYQHGKTTNNLSDLTGIPNIPYYTPQSSNTTSGGILLDFVYFPYKKVGFAASMGSLSYSHNDVKQTQYGYDSSSNTFGFNFFSSVNFSVFYAFGK